MAVASWLPDPTGVHELRYWNGSTWTEHVSDQGMTAQDALTTELPPPADTLPPPPAPPPAGTADALTYCGAPWRIDGGGWALRRTAPRLGEHTDQILTDDAGYSPEHIRALHDQGVVLDLRDRDTGPPG